VGLKWKGFELLGCGSGCKPGGHGSCATECDGSLDVTAKYEGDNEDGASVWRLIRVGSLWVTRASGRECAVRERLRGPGESACIDLGLLGCLAMGEEYELGRLNLADMGWDAGPPFRA